MSKNFKFKITLTMLIQNYDFVFQLRESFVDLLGKASFYGDLYPHYFPYTDKAFHDQGGGPRYVFIAPPSIQTEVRATSPGNFLKISLPFRLSRPDDVEAMIDGVLEAEVGIKKEPETGVPDRIRLDFATLQFGQINSQALAELSENIKQADLDSKVLLLFMLGGDSVDENGNIQFDELIQTLLIEFLQNEIGSIDISPALKELGRFDLNLKAVDYKVIDSPANSPQADALSLMLDFEGSPLNGNKAALGSLFNGSQNFAMGMSQRLAQSVVDQQFANGNIPSVIDGVHAFPIHISEPKIAFHPGQVNIALHAKTKVRVNYLFWKTNHDVAADLEAIFGLSIDANGRPQVQGLSVVLRNVSASGFLGFLTSLFGPGKIQKAIGDSQVAAIVNKLLDSTGLLRLSWNLPGDIPFKLKAVANSAQINEAELLLMGNGQLAHPDNNIFTPPATYSYPPSPEAFVGMDGYAKRVRRLISSNTTTFSKPDREFNIWVPCTGNVPEAYAQLPELQAAIDAGQCGNLRFNVHYNLPWSKLTKTYKNIYNCQYSAVLQFMAPGALNLSWFLQDATEIRRPSTNPIGTGNSVDFQIAPPDGKITPNKFSKKLVLKVLDSFGKTRYGSTIIDGFHKESIVTEQVAASELAVYQRELLLEQLQELSDILSMQHASGQLPQAPAKAPQFITISGPLEPIASEMQVLEELV